MKHAVSRLVLVTIAVLLAFTSPAKPDDGTRTLSGADATAMTQVLRNLAYIPDGTDTGKRLYVLFTPTCVYCKVLFEQTRSLTEHIQIRWILCSDLPELQSIYEHPTPANVAAVFNKAPLPKNAHPDRNERINRYSMGGIYFLLVKGYLAEHQSHFAFPTLVYTEGDDVKVVTGLPTNPAEFIRELPKGQPEEPFQPLAIRLAEQRVDFTPAPKGLEYENTHEEDIPIRLMPFDDAPLIGAVLSGSKLTGLPVVGVSADGYLALSYGGTDPHLYIQDKSFAEQAMAQ